MLQILNKFGHDESPLCPSCGVTEDAEHILTTCPRFEYERQLVENEIGDVVDTSTLCSHMLRSPSIWSAVSCFAKVVMDKLRSLERGRSRQTQMTGQ